MTLPSSGDISMSDILTEFEMSGQLNLNSTTLRAYLDILSGDISMSDFYNLDVVWVYSGGIAFWEQINGTHANYRFTDGRFGNNVEAVYYHDNTARYIRGPNVTGNYYKIARISI